MRDLHKLLAKQDFQTKEEIEAFMQKISQGPIPEFEPENDEELAEEMVHEAMSLGPAEQRELIMEALDLDPDCIAAYALLGWEEGHPAIALAFYERGVSIGAEKFLSEEFLAQHKGHFWGFTETRPFMRCLKGIADSHFFLGRVPEAVGIWEQLLELNPSDNQGVRYDLMLVLAGMRIHDEFEKLEKQFNDDVASATYFNRVLYHFTKNGAGPKAQQALDEAVKANPHVVPLLLQRDPKLRIAPAFMLGSEEEAHSYMDKAHHIWWGVPGALDWLKKVAGKKGK